MADEPNGTGQADLAGYPDANALAKGYRESSAEAKKWRDHASQLEQQLAQRQQVPQRDQSGRFVPSQPERPEDKLAAYGVPTDALEAYLNQRIQQVFEPIAQAAGGRNVMLQKHPDYNKFEADVAQYIGADPELSTRYQRMFQADPVGAMEFAFLKFGDSRRGQQQATDNGARNEAQIPSNRTGTGANAPAEPDERLRQGWDNYQKTGNPTAYIKGRLGQVLSKEFLGER